MKRAVLLLGCLLASGTSHAQGYRQLWANFLPPNNKPVTLQLDSPGIPFLCEDCTHIQLNPSDTYRIGHDGLKRSSSGHAHIGTIEDGVFIENRRLMKLNLEFTTNNQLPLVIAVNPKNFPDQSPALFEVYPKTNRFSGLADDKPSTLFILESGSPSPEGFTKSLIPILSDAWKLACERALTKDLP